MCGLLPIPPYLFVVVFCFFQAEDGIRDSSVTGVQTCALPISSQRPGGRDPGSEDHAPGKTDLRRGGRGEARPARKEVFLDRRRFPPEGGHARLGPGGRRTELHFDHADPSRPDELLVVANPQEMEVVRDFSPCACGNRKRILPRSSSPGNGLTWWRSSSRKAHPGP